MNEAELLIIHLDDPSDEFLLRWLKNEQLSSPILPPANSSAAFS